MCQRVLLCMKLYQKPISYINTSLCYGEAQNKAFLTAAPH